MSNKLLLAVIMLSFIAGGICGYAVKSAFTGKGAYENSGIKTEIVLRKVPVTIKETKFIVKEKAVLCAEAAVPPFSFADSVKGVKDSVEYNIIHVINKNDSIESRWDVKLTGLLKETVREKTLLQIKQIEVPKPFYSDGWFWSTLIAVPLLFLAIIF